MSSLRLLTLLLPTLLCACGLGREDVNDPIDARAVASLQPGVTTAREVVEKLGAPTEVVQLGKRSAYRYDASTTKMTGLVLVVMNFYTADQRSDRVWLFFDEHDVLTHYGASYGTHRTQYALPWEDVHEDSDNVARDAERPGLGAK